MSKAGVNGISSILLRYIRENIGSIHFSSLEGIIFWEGNLKLNVCPFKTCSIRAYATESSVLLVGLLVWDRT